MLILRIIGFEARRGICVELIGKLKTVVSTVKELGITPQQVSPFILQNAIQGTFEKTVVAYTDGLFGKSERTPEVCQQLADVIYGAVCNIIRTYGLTDVQFIEVINNKINPVVDGYKSGNPHEEVV